MLSATKILLVADGAAGTGADVESLDVPVTALYGATQTCISTANTVHSYVGQNIVFERLALHADFEVQR